MSKKFDSTKIAFVLSLCLASFGLGVAAMEFRFFPYSLAKEARASVMALLHAHREHKEFEIAPQASDRLSAPEVRRHSGRGGEELVLISGATDYLKSYSPHGALAWIMDREGTVKHVWHLPEEHPWGDSSTVKCADESIQCRGLHLYPNGDILVSIQGKTCWPYGLGMARFDKDSKLIWKKELHSHHWFSVGDDGRVYTPVHRTVDAPYSLAGKHEKLPGAEGKLLLDSIMVVDPDDGSVIEEISVVEAIVAADRIGILSTESDWDPIHLNDAWVVTKDMAQGHPLLEPGDILVSIRECSTLGVLDAKTRRFKWLTSGATVKQHSPRLFDGGLLSFDNRGGSEDSHHSRLHWIDMMTGKSRTLFPRPGVSIPEPFFSRYEGRIDLNPDKRRALVTVTELGSVWEVDLLSGEVPWEYRYTHPHDPGPRRKIHNAEYVSEARFPMNCEEKVP